MNWFRRFRRNHVSGKPEHVILKPYPVQPTGVIAPCLCGWLSPVCPSAYAALWWTVIHVNLNGGSWGGWIHGGRDDR